MRILIVEDDLLIAEMLKDMLINLKHDVICICTSYEEVFEKLETNSTIDLVFLDINLEKDKNGIDIGSELNTNYSIPFIYLTSYSDPKSIKEASKTLPETYLTKPFNEIQLLTTLEIVKQKIEVKLKTVTIKDGTESIRLLVSEICYIKSDKNYLEIYTLGKRYIIRDTMDSFLKEITSSLFVRVHRSYAVNVSCIESLSTNEIKLNQISIPLSRIYRKKLMEIYQS